MFYDRPRFYVPTAYEEDHQHGYHYDYVRDEWVADDDDYDDYYEEEEA